MTRPPSNRPASEDAPRPAHLEEPAAQRKMPPFVPVIPAGGAGTRLWPLSRRRRPKFLLDLTGGGRTLLQATLDRVGPLADRPPIIVTGAAHADDVAAQTRGAAQILVEPSPRNSMPAIALAAAFAEREDPSTIIGSFAADHLVDDQDAFATAVSAARETAALGYLVTLGIVPTSAATGFGYIEQAAGQSVASRGDALAGTGARPVLQFVEKPDSDRAEQFIATGRFFWNAGMYVVRASVLLDALSEQIPDLAAGARAIAAAAFEGGDACAEASTGAMARIWPHLMSVSIDHALAEPLAAQGRVAVVPAGFAWEDIGDFAALARLLRTQDSCGSTRIDVREEVEDVIIHGGARAVSVGARATVHSDSSRVIALVGVRDISLVETEDVLLVLAESRAQELAELVSSLDGTSLAHLA